MRGNQTGLLVALIGGGSIPAYAGEPLVGYGLFSPLSVYPRVCGGTDGSGESD